MAYGYQYNCRGDISRPGPGQCEQGDSLICLEAYSKNRFVLFSTNDLYRTQTIGWMVLIAAEMLAQNPGLGRFIWDEFQNGSSDSLGRIMVAVLTIGFIGFLLDKLILLIQRRISWDKQTVLR